MDPIRFIAVAFISFASMAIAAAANEVQKYEVVNGNNDNAYLVNTATGFVWILTYRTMATGREPVAIPYKFIKISPKNDKNLSLKMLRAPSIYRHNETSNGSVHQVV